MIDFSRLIVISGGQAGVDRAALDAAMATGLAHGGACPAGRAAEDGMIDAAYRLVETKTADPAERTRLNVENSVATLVLCAGPPVGGTRLTVDHARTVGRPFLVVNPFSASAASDIADWLDAGAYPVLNVAGPRESECPGIYRSAVDVLTRVFQASLDDI